MSYLNQANGMNHQQRQQQAPQSVHQLQAQQMMGQMGRGGDVMMPGMNGMGAAQGQGRGDELKKCDFTQSRADSRVVMCSTLQAFDRLSIFPFHGDIRAQNGYQHRNHHRRVSLAWKWYSEGGMLIVGDLCLCLCLWE